MNSSLYMPVFMGAAGGRSASPGNVGRKRRGGPYAPGVTFAPAPYAYRSQWPNDPKNVAGSVPGPIEDVIRFTTSDDVAAFIVEPVMGEGGIIVPPRNYFKEVKKVLDHHGILFIADEVQSDLLAPERCLPSSTTVSKPDILVTAKGHCRRFSAECVYHTTGDCSRIQPGDHLSLWRQSSFMRCRTRQQSNS